MGDEAESCAHEHAGPPMNLEKMGENDPDDGKDDDSLEHPSSPVCCKKTPELPAER
jgi:hypothetical protein